MPSLQAVHRLPAAVLLLSALSAAFSAGAQTTGAAPAAAAPLRAEGSEWVLQVPGRTLRSADLVGAQFQLAGGATLRIDGVRRADDGEGHSWWAHELSVKVPRAAATDWQPLCAAHSDGTHYAVVLPGREQADGALADDAASYAVSCTSGALAKCLRMGYEPWQAGASGQPPAGATGTARRATFNACVRMVRGDYSGSGVPFTENGRQIDIYDPLGVQKPEMSATQTFEAGWTAQGAVCVHHMRVAGKLGDPQQSGTDLAELEARYPQLRGRTGAICTEDFARAHGALVFNRSNDTTTSVPTR